LKKYYKNYFTHTQAFELEKDIFKLLLKLKSFDVNSEYSMTNFERIMNDDGDDVDYKLKFTFK